MNGSYRPEERTDENRLSQDDIPPFSMYFPQVQQMSDNQRAFYARLEPQLERGRYPAVNGNISYLFLYVYSIIDRFAQEYGQQADGPVAARKRQYTGVYSQLLDLAEAYHEESKFAQHCRYWAADCLIATESYDEYLTLTEPSDLFSKDVANCNVRCNVCYHLGRPANPVDLFQMRGFHVTDFTTDHAGPFTDFLQESIMSDAERNGPWLDRLRSPWVSFHNEETIPKPIFSGAAGPVFMDLQLWGGLKAPLPQYCFHAKINLIDDAIRQAENQLRDAHGVPRVGEGWVAETELFHAIRDAFPETTIIQHGRPEWLGKQHFDIWIPRWRIAVEYHGAQHFEPIAVFGGSSGLERTQERDRRKLTLCGENNAHLIIVREGTKHDEVMACIRAARKSLTTDV